ncbi:MULTISPECIES: macro domain-containing protein [Streptacidiphilus]|uniref:Macro domain-containing protein n=1 Tax=Streptacidiphilus cavernicola TaxID=3342716 RepID=A0ABV6UK42_9ACTN|nr:macro domain-containing protein [Streptacidiphilus jeojiense]
MTEPAINPVALCTAAALLVLGLGMILLGVRAAGAGQRPVVLVAAWLCVALAVDLVIFGFFPEDRVDGEAFGFRLGGAAALFLVVWLVCFRVHRQALALEQPAAMLRQSQEEAAALRERLAALTAERRPTRLATNQRLRHPLVADPGREIGIITGDLRDIDFVDVWVNSENTDFQMSRFHESSVSGLIRYEGARRDASGRVVEDCIADELAARVRGRTPVMPGTAIVTGPGKLGGRNRVRRIIHVASVQGEPGNGYRQVRSVARCVSNALALAEAEPTDGGPPCQSIVFPLLGAGEAHADPATTALTLLTAAYEYLSADRPVAIRAIHFLAFTDAELAACRYAAEQLPGLKTS